MNLFRQILLGFIGLLIMGTPSLSSAASKSTRCAVLFDSAFGTSNSYFVKGKRVSNNFPDSVMLKKSTPLPGNTLVSDLIDPDGNIILFRMIDEPYDPNYRKKLPYRLLNGISYSLSPAIVKTWGEQYLQRARSNPDLYILVAQNNIFRQSIKAGQWNPRDDLEEGHTGSDLLRSSKTITIPHTGDMGLNEARVPEKQEAVIAVIHINDWNRIMEQLPEEFKINDLILHLRSELPGRLHGGSETQP